MPTNPSSSSKEKTTAGKTARSSTSTTPKKTSNKAGTSSNRTKSTQTKTSTTKKGANAKTNIESLENTLDTFAETTAKSISKKVSPGIATTTKKITSTAKKIGATVESMGNTVEQEVDKTLPNDTGSDLLLNFEFNNTVSRLFIFRPLWLIIQLPLMYFWSIWIVIISIVHYIYMFLMGRRNVSLRDDQTRYMRHIYKWKSYVSGMTDKRPKIIED